MTKDKGDWIGVDFDGTLAHSATGAPIAPMMNRVHKWIVEGKRIKIFTARADRQEDIEQIRAWLRDNDLPNFDITNIKDSEMVEFWDDRAVSVQRNTGYVLTK